MPKNLNDVLKGVKKSTTSKLTTGENPGVDYADKSKDTIDFFDQHPVQKHEDRVGNGDDVYKASNVKKASMLRHGHEPKPKDIRVYDKTNQATNEEVEELDEADLMHIRNYDILNKDEIQNYDKESVNNNNMKTIQKKNDLDSKIFNKSNKSQKLFKDSKTIAGRFTKNSIIDDYKNELDYYEKLRTPWWVSEAKYD